MTEMHALSCRCDALLALVLLALSVADEMLLWTMPTDIAGWRLAGVAFGWLLLDVARYVCVMALAWRLTRRWLAAPA